MIRGSAPAGIVPGKIAAVNILPLNHAATRLFGHAAVAASVVFQSIAP